jgi:ribosomal protein L44E
MPNRQLTKDELEKLAYPLLAEVRGKLQHLSNGDKELLWALRRKITKELGYDERNKPAHRTALKKKKRKDQNGLCAQCSKPLPEDGSVLDRLEAMGGYTDENTRVLCPGCDREVQVNRRFK